MIVIFEILVLLFLIYKRYMPIAFWFMSIMLFHLSFEGGNEMVYLETIEDYPAEDSVKPKKFKFLYKKISALPNYKDIPKEMYFCETMKAYGFIIYSAVALPMFFLNEKFSNLLGVIYIGFYCLLSVLSAFILKRKSFICKFKILNKSNLKYIFLPNNEPSPQKVGDCKIVATTRKFKRTFATVVMLKTGETKKVLLSENKPNLNSIYCVYEICKVLYAKQSD